MYSERNYPYRRHPFADESVGYANPTYMHLGAGDGMEPHEEDAPDDDKRHRSRGRGGGGEPEWLRPGRPRASESCAIWTFLSVLIVLNLFLGFVCTIGGFSLMSDTFGTLRNPHITGKKARADVFTIQDARVVEGEVGDLRVQHLAVEEKIEIAGTHTLNFEFPLSMDTIGRGDGVRIGATTCADQKKHVAIGGCPGTDAEAFNPGTCLVHVNDVSGDDFEVGSGCNRARFKTHVQVDGELRTTANALVDGKLFVKGNEVALKSDLHAIERDAGAVIIEGIELSDGSIMPAFSTGTALTVNNLVVLSDKQVQSIAFGQSAQIGFTSTSINVPVLQTDTIRATRDSAGIVVPGIDTEATFLTTANTDSVNFGKVQNEFAIIQKQRDGRNIFNLTFARNKYGDSPASMTFPSTNATVLTDVNTEDFGFVVGDDTDDASVPKIKFKIKQDTRKLVFQSTADVWTDYTYVFPDSSTSTTVITTANLDELGLLLPTPDGLPRLRTGDTDKLIFNTGVDDALNREYTLPGTGGMIMLEQDYNDKSLASACNGGNTGDVFVCTASSTTTFELPHPADSNIAREVKVIIKCENNAASVTITSSGEKNFFKAGATVSGTTATVSCTSSESMYKAVTFTSIGDAGWLVEDPEGAVELPSS